MIFKIKATVQVKKKKKGFGKPFNPNFDGNLLAWYDGDTLATDPPATWTDRSGNAYDLTLFNAPTIISPAINGHDALQFDGINQYAQRLLTPVLNQPNSIYIVFVQFNYALASGTIIVGSGINSHAIFQNGGSPNLDLYAGLIAPSSNPDIPLATYDILTCVFNGANSEIRTNNNAANIGNSGLLNTTGLNISANNVFLNFVNMEIAYLIIRSAADNTATQNLFINYLKNRFAL